MGTIARTAVALGLTLEPRQVRALAADLKGQQRVTAAVDLPPRAVDNQQQADVLVALGQAVRRVLAQAGWDGRQVISVGLAGHSAMWAASQACIQQLVGHALPPGGGRPGTAAGRLAGVAADQWGLTDRVVVATPACWHRAAVPGVGVAEPSTMVAVLQVGHPLLLNSRHAAGSSYFNGPWRGEILPGYEGYEIHVPQLWSVLQRIAAGGSSAQATGCDARENLMHDLFIHAGLVVRQTADRLRQAGIFCRRFVVAGELATRCPKLVEVMAHVLQERVTVHPTPQPAVLGAAVLGVLAAMDGGERVAGLASMSAAIQVLARARTTRRELKATMFAPDRRAADEFDRLYEAFCQGRWCGAAHMSSA